jgi:hypothetical protein
MGCLYGAKQGKHGKQQRAGRGVLLTLRADKMRSAPISASRIASASPIPDDAPVTHTTFPSNAAATTASDTPAKGVNAWWD